MIDNEQWLELGEEAALEPALPIVDPHHHLWETSPRRPGLPYRIGEFERDASAHNVVASVYVECGTAYLDSGPAHLRPVGEVQWVDAAARGHAQHAPARSGICAGIVAHADLTLGAAVDEVLDALHEAAPARLRGIRHATAWDADDQVRYKFWDRPAELMRQDAFRAGFARLARRGLSFDAWLFHPQIVELAELARDFPDTTVILDHLGGPLGAGSYAGRADAVLEAWKRGIDALARCANAFVKLGGLNMQINGFGWHERARPPSSAELAAAGRRYYQYALEKFGPGRCMFESNFPVDRIACSYTVQWNAFKRAAADAGLSAAEKAAVFHDNARRIYRLD
ncbi:MAG: amidohydrolase [Gammaproteobacteria bacterium]